MKNPLLYRSGSAGRRSGGARSVPDRAVGLRWQAAFGSSDRLE